MSSCSGHIVLVPTRYYHSFLLCSISRARAFGSVLRSGVLKAAPWGDVHLEDRRPSLPGRGGDKVVAGDPIAGPAVVPGAVPLEQLPRDIVDGELHGVVGHVCFLQAEQG